MKVLIIDDEPDIRDYLTAVLEDNGYTAKPLTTDETFSDVIRSDRPDLIILDIMMPKRSGISIYKELRSTDEYKNIPIAIISGMMPEKSFKKGFGKLLNDDSIALPDGFIEKPVQLESLKELLDKILK